VDHAQRLAGVIEGNEQRIILHAGKSKDRVHPVPAEHFDQGFAPRHLCHHFLAAVIWSFPRRREPRGGRLLRGPPWTPACAGVTTEVFVARPLFEPIAESVALRYDPPHRRAREMRRQEPGATRGMLFDEAGPGLA